MDSQYNTPVSVLKSVLKGSKVNLKKGVFVSWTFSFGQLKKIFKWVKKKL